MRWLLALAGLAVGWLFTLVMGVGNTCGALLGFPGPSWVFFRGRWGRGALRCIGTSVDLVGAEHMAQPGVYVSNHESLLDVVVLPAVLPGELKFVAKKELWRVPGLGWALGLSGAIMIDRTNREAAVQAMRRGLKKLPPGWSLVVFPEGTRSRDGLLKPFKKGAFHLAIQTGLPVIPVGIAGARQLIPKGEWLPMPGTVHVTIGAPISSTSWRHDALQKPIEVVRGAVQGCVDLSRSRAEALGSLPSGWRIAV